MLILEIRISFSENKILRLNSKKLKIKNLRILKVTFETENATLIFDLEFLNF